MTECTPIDDACLSARLLNLILEMSCEEKLRLLNELDRVGKNGSSRKYVRKSWVIPVSYVSEAKAYRDVIRDISAGGVFIETQIPLAVGAEITMKFRMPGKGKLIQARGEIVRTDPIGIGVKFKRQPQ